MEKIIAPSILAADFTKLESEVKMINESEAGWIHFDVMDGRFVPNISFGFPILKAIKSVAEKPIDVHLMIEDPDKYLHQFWEAGADVITVHYEACPHLHRTVHAIKDMGIKAGVALNPHTPVSVLESIIQDIDLVCVMSVNPGFGGQSFIENTFKKVQQLSDLIRKANAKTLIEIDGGVSLKNIDELVRCGANVLVAGSTVFKSDNPKDTISKMLNSTSPQWA